jgi:hypothetical protein
LFKLGIRNKKLKRRRKGKERNLPALVASFISPDPATTPDEGITTENITTPSIAMHIPITRA